MRLRAWHEQATNQIIMYLVKIFKVSHDLIKAKLLEQIIEATRIDSLWVDMSLH